MVNMVIITPAKQQHVSIVIVNMLVCSANANANAANILPNIAHPEHGSNQHISLNVH